MNREKQPFNNRMQGEREREKAYLSEASLYVAELTITFLSVGLEYETI